MKEDDKGRGRQHRPRGEIELPAGGKAGVQAEGDAERRDQHQRHRAQLLEPRLEHELGAGEHAGHQHEQRDAELDAAIERAHERGVRDLGR